MTEVLKDLVRSATGYRPTGSKSTDCPLQDADVARAMNAMELSPLQLCDAFARMSAELCVSGELSYEEADGAVNALHWYSSMGPWNMDLLPEFSWQIYLAFDAGEHDHGGRFPNSVTELTFPRLEELLARE